MPELASLTRQKPVNVTIDLGDGDTVTVTFDRNKVTPGWVDAMQKRGDGDALALSHGLAETIHAWDVTEDGQPFPPTGENIGQLSYGAQKALLEQIMRASVPGEAEGKASSVLTSTAHSVSTPLQPTSPNGPATSPSLAPSESPSPT